MGCLYVFGNFRLDPATRELHHGEAPVAVPPRAFDVLVYLVEHRERAVGRDELIAAVWGRTEIGDGMLGQTILSARRALEDTGKEQQFIRTVIRFGYHWIAPVAVIEVPLQTDEAAAPVAAVPADEAIQGPPPAGAAVTAVADGTGSRRWLWPLLALVVGALIVPGLWWWASPRRHAPADTNPPSSTSAQARVALVMPVQVSAASGHDWIRLGLMDLIASRLREAGLAVVPSDNVVMLSRRFARPDSDPAALAQAAAANLVIDAHADAIAGGWRVSLQTVYGNTPPVAASAEAPDVLVAARAASDRLARALGFTPRADVGADVAATDPSILLGQIDAAILGDRLDNARALVAEATPAERARPEVRLRIAQIDYQAGDLATAERAFAAIVQSVGAEQDAVLHARALTDLGIIAATRGDLPAATRRMDAAITLLRPASAPDALGKALNARGNVAGAQGRYDEALQYFAEARIAFESAGNMLAAAVLDSNLASVDMHRQHYAEAERTFTRAASRFAVFGVNAAELNALTAAAELRLALLEPDTALATEPRLRELVAAVADPARQRTGELTRLQVLVANGRYREVDTALPALLSAADAANDRAAQMGAHALGAELALERGDAASAATNADAAVQRIGAGDDARVQAKIRLLQVRARLADGQSAADAVAALTAFAERDASPSTRVHAALARALAAADGDAAAPMYAQAMAAADMSRIPADLREVVDANAQWLIRRGDLEQAAALAERVTGWVARDYASALLRLRVYHALGRTGSWRAALARVHALAGERTVPADLQVAPTDA